MKTLRQVALLIVADVFWSELDGWRWTTRARWAQRSTPG